MRRRRINRMAAACFVTMKDDHWNAFFAERDRRTIAYLRWVAR